MANKNVGHNITRNRTFLYNSESITVKRPLLKSNLIGIDSLIREKEIK